MARELRLGGAGVRDCDAGVGQEGRPTKPEKVTAQGLRSSRKSVAARSPGLVGLSHRPRRKAPVRTSPHQAESLRPPGENGQDRLSVRVVEPKVCGQQAEPARTICQWGPSSRKSAATRQRRPGPSVGVAPSSRKSLATRQNRTKPPVPTPRGRVEDCRHRMRSLGRCRRSKAMHPDVAHHWPSWAILSSVRTTVWFCHRSVIAEANDPVNPDAVSRLKA